MAMRNLIRGGQSGKQGMYVNRGGEHILVNFSFFFIQIYLLL